MALTPERVRLFRADYRRENISPRYRGWLHLGFTLIVCGIAIAISLALVEDPPASAWLAIPIGWVIANLTEYGMHRGPMHHLGRLGARLYKRHTSEHHRFFSIDVPEIDEVADFQATLFPPWMALVFVGLLGVPMALLVAALFGRDTALIFYAGIVFYYFNFEWIHLALHLPEDWRLARLPGIRFARRHHAIHHDPSRMRRVNFNFAFPLGDWLFGTLER